MRDFHFIGHSLGAHICSFVSFNLGGVSRITGLYYLGNLEFLHDYTKKYFNFERFDFERNCSGTLKLPLGLDPAQPCFRTSNIAERLDKSDADFVDVIHTNGRLLKKIGFGLPEPTGPYQL